MFGRRSVLKSAAAALVGAALPTGSRAVAALPADTSKPVVEIVDDPTRRSDPVGDLLRDDAYWKRRKYDRLNALLDKAEAHGYPVDRTPIPYGDIYQFRCPSFQFIYQDKPDMQVVTVLGANLDDDILTLLFSMLPHGVA